MISTQLVLSQAAEKLNVLKLSDAQRRSYDRYIERPADEQSYYESTYVRGHDEGHQKGLQKGLQEGHEQGAKNKAIEIAKALKAAGVDLATIAATSGLSQQEIKAL
ncbi:MAG: hypothetical protein AAF310_03145 [Myxococcota bacterium]